MHRFYQSIYKNHTYSFKTLRLAHFCRPIKYKPLTADGDNANGALLEQKSVQKQYFFKNMFVCTWKWNDVDCTTD